MQKIGLRQSLSQKLSPQQIQFIKLLQVPTAELSTRIEEELEINPALEEGREESTESADDLYEQENDVEDFNEEIRKEEADIDIGEYLGQEDYAYKMQGDGYDPNAETKEVPIAVNDSLADDLLEQLGLLDLTEKQIIIGRQLIGSIENDGYIRREMDAIVNDLMFRQGLAVEVEEVDEVLKIIQQFDPAGIAARTLQECLLIQLEHKKENHPEAQPIVDAAHKIISFHFDEFVKKHYDKIQKKMGNISDTELKEAINLITKLNPKPGGAADSTKPQYVIPDYILVNNNSKLELSLNGRNAPELKVSRGFSEMLESYDKSNKKDKDMRDAVSFIKQKLDAAKWFIDAIQQRQQTLLKTMHAILTFQQDFFQTGDESSLRPMILKDIADRIDMDISTVSRVVNSKYIQTEFGVYPLKYFFSEGISTDSGEDASSREVKQIIKEIIDREDKFKPMADDAISDILNKKGYNIARRTVAKYREQLNIPVARLRKEL